MMKIFFSIALYKEINNVTLCFAKSTHIFFNKFIYFYIIKYVDSAFVYIKCECMYICTLCVFFPIMDKWTKYRSIYFFILKINERD